MRWLAITLLAGMVAGIAWAQLPMQGIPVGTKSVNNTPGTCTVSTFDGSSAYAVSATLTNVSGGTVFSIATWFNLTSIGSDTLSWEYTANYNNGMGGFISDVGSTSPDNGDWDLGYKPNSGSGHSISGYSRPSTSAWHSVVAIYDQANSASGTPVVVYLDGTVQSPLANMHASPSGTWASDVIYLMSRAGSSLFQAGKMSQFAIWPGTTLTSGDATNINNGNGFSGIEGGPSYWWKLNSTSAIANSGSGGTNALTPHNTTTGSVTGFECN